MPPEASEMAKYGEAPAFTVSAQKPSKPDPRKSMLNPVMRMPPVFQPYNRSTPAASPEPRTRTPQPANPLKRASPAPLTFIEQKPALNPLDQPNKRRRVEEKPPKYKFSNKKTPFSIHRPLKNIESVHKDVWTSILGWSTPRFLLQAKTVCSLFYEILSQQSLWRQARLRHLSTSLPCPDGITEQQYADLLVGRGCQNPACRRENTSSTNWALLVRLCPDCLVAFTTRIQDLPPARLHRVAGNLNLGDCLPMLSLTASHRSEPREVSTDEEDGPYTESSRSSTHRFLSSAYDCLEAEYFQLRDGGASEEEITVWWKAKADLTRTQMKERGEIHRWSLNNHYRAQAADIRTDREAFFVEKALKLDPPMSRSTLNCFAAFKKALATQNAPTERSWETLKAKILPLREDAEQLEQALKRMERGGSEDTWEKLATHRSFGLNKVPPELKPEQEFIVNLASKEFQRCLDSGVSDADLVLLTLKNVYDRYYNLEKRPQGLNYNCRNGPYQLSFDDCRLILDLVIKKEIPSQSQRGTKVFSRFRCPACVREKERGRLFSFSGCLEHIISTHSKLVDGETEFWRFALAERPQRGAYWYRILPFPWYTLRMPRCLPVLPEHQDPAALEPWDPDSTRPYLQETLSTTSIFEGRKVNSQVEAGSFIDLFKHAAKTLSGVRLTGQALTRIALQYAIEASKQYDMAEPSLEQFIAAVPQIQGINPAMDFRFRCGLCMANGDQKASSRHIKHNQPIDSLLTHWRKAHEEDAPGPVRRRDAQDSSAEARDWKVDFFHLPSDTELFDEVTESDGTLEREKESIRAAAAGSNARKKPKAKASLILSTPAALDVFSALFSRIEGPAEAR